MKHFRIILSITIAAFSFSAVHAKATPNIAIADTVGYRCPMKCEGEKTYDKAGKCPVCNMKLSKLKAKKETQNYGDPNHN